jgi:pyrroloquinoline quinone (PQQ) biosynthesis protein C
MSVESVIARMDEVVNDFSTRVKFLSDDITRGRAQMFVLQHRQNTRFRNSVCKPKVATNCPVWDVRVGILEACAEEIIADNEFGDGRPHWQVLQDLGVDIGLTVEEIENAELLPSTRMSWLAWETLCGNRHWLEGLVANTCAERTNIPGYGTGAIREHGWMGAWKPQWATAFGLTPEQLTFFGMHSEADIKHSDLGWRTVANYAAELGMEDAAVEACRINLMVWEQYLNGIAEAGDRREETLSKAA